MKLIAVLALCLFAVAVQASTYDTMRKEAELMAVFEPPNYPVGRDGVIETIKDYIEGAIQSIKERVQGVIEKAKQVAADVKDKVSDIVNQATAKIHAFVSETEAKLVDLKNKGVAYKDCAIKYEPELAEIALKAKDDVMKCTKDALEYAENVHGNAVDQLLIVKEQVKILREAIQLCYQPARPVTSVTCAVMKAKEVVNAVVEIVKNASGALTAGTTVVTQSYGCVKDSLTISKAQSEAIFSKIKACAAQGAF